MSVSYIPELAQAAEEAVGRSMANLFAEFPDEYYYVALVVFGEADMTYISAWSNDSLAVKIADSGLPVEDALLAFKWSYGDSPFYAYGEEFFDEVRRILRFRAGIDELDDAEWQAEFDLRLASFEEAMRRLDRRGLFGVGSERSRVMINVEVMPPDPSNTERAIRLNPFEAIEEWLEEAAEIDT
jgi:Domain of unknown function (DUF4303)